jgi:DNA-binding NtrC family response regulator/tetratricopeptide (TPR) repeat protein
MPDYRQTTEAEGLYWQGRMQEAQEACTRQLEEGPPAETVVSLMMVQGMAAFDAGRVSDSIEILSRASILAEQSSRTLFFQSRLALFSRLSQFNVPEDAVGLLAEVRQLAHASGTAQSLGSLHLVVARLEAIRGLCVSAKRHLEISRRLLAAAGPRIQSAIHQVEAGLEAYAGNLQRAKRSASRGLEIAQVNGLRPIQAGCLTNLGSVLSLSGRHQDARPLLYKAVELCKELPVIRYSAIDALAQLSLSQGHMKECLDNLEICLNLRSSHRLPSRSWYDLAHQITRCSYHEHMGDWDSIVAIVDDAGPTVARRQYKAVQTSLLCAKARALAHLGRHDEAEAELATAVRVCPRSAVDPLIVLEASKALCATLYGDVRGGAIHFDRALAGCEAIGHRYHEKWITTIRDRVTRTTQVTVPRRLDLDTTEAALVLNDVATILGAGHSIDLMAHRVTSVIESTGLRARVEVEREGNCEYQPEPSATWEAASDGSIQIRLRGSDRRIDIRVAQVRSIEEFSLLKSLADIVQAGVNRTAETEHEDSDQNLWPLATVATDDSTVFRSPRMIELLKIAMRLANTHLPVLITGETGTGKEIFARLIHQNSRVKRGPFVPFNCATVPRDLVESQLFGHRRGAFTGASESFAGLIRSAEHGTLFLDEVGDLDLTAQPKLLRFLESGEIQPLGELRPQRVGVRLVAATNANLESLASQGRFRQDLLYRLGVAVLVLPPLRERKDEIPALASFFLAKSAGECGRTGVKLADDFLAALLLYDWPGNIRELANEIRRAVALADDGDTLGARHLAPDIARLWHARAGADAPAAPQAPGLHVRLDQTLAEAVSELEERFIEHALQSTGGRVTEAAQLLGLSRKGLFLKRRRRGLVPGQDQPDAAEG